MRKLVLATLVLVLVLAVGASAMEMRKRIAISELEDKAGSSYNVGTGLSDVLATALVNCGKFQVFEREQLAAVMKEQALGTTGLVTPQTAPEIGKLLGVQAIVYGAVTEFSTQKDEVGLGTFMGGMGFSRVTARVGLNIRLIDTVTGEIIFSHEATGEESEAGGVLMVPGMIIGKGSEWDNTLEGKAARKAIDEIVNAIIAKLKNVPWTGAVVKADGDKVYINAGVDSGIELGMEFRIFAKGEELIDPVTGISLGAEETLIGTVQVMDVKEKYAICRSVAGGGFSDGDIVRENPFR
ncbi:MAG TPA: hypothetical protein ENN88_01110 [Candidatus Coatesbacteria bacterium]|nr:hypothetical protein [Candidatus Coatesbacteria bacterium]